MSNFPAFHSSFDSRHLQEQADSRAFAKDGADIGHDLAIFTHVEGRRDSSASGLEAASVVKISGKPGEDCLHCSEKFW